MLTMDETDTRVQYRSQESRESEHHEGADDTEIFEITDFTTASDWERFIARLEDVIHDWKLPHFVPETKFRKDAFTHGPWRDDEKVDITDVPDFEFWVNRHRLKSAETVVDGHTSSLDNPVQRPGTGSTLLHPASLSKTSFSVNEFPAIFEQMLSTENDFAPTKPFRPIAQWFGLADFLVLTVSPFNCIDWKVSEDRFKLILSSMAVAVSSTKCPIPVFLQYDDLDRKMFAGVSEVTGFRTMYEIIHLEKVSNRQRTLSSLVEMFKEKISPNADRVGQLMKASIQFTVELNPDEVDFDGLSEELLDDRKPDGLGTLPFGPLEFDSFVLLLFTSWPNANADAIEDTLLHTDLDPMQAPKWAVQLVLNDASSYRLADTLSKFAKNVHRKETIQSFLEYLEKSETDKSDQATEILGRLTGERQDHLRSRLSKAFYSRMPKFHFPVPIDLGALNDILAYLFPDSELAKDLNRDYPSFKDRSEPAFRTMKAAPCGSLPFKLALAVHFVYEKFGGLLGVAYLWQEVILELRYRWENGFVISGVESGLPNHGTCLLHQKLQMLNCCIAKREADRTACTAGGQPLPSQIKSSDSQYFDVTDDEEEDEFYDCETDDGVVGDRENAAQKPLRPEGRKEMHPTLKLLKDGVTPLYIPDTQEPAPLTEDRAANPGCCFEDFVRWHSPRDWEDDDGGGRLSERMGQVGSAWMDAWESAECKPVRKQKRLFDERVEAEKVLSFLNMTIGNVFRHTLPMLLQASLLKLFAEMDGADISPPCDQQMLGKSLSKWLSDHTANWPEFEKIIKTVRLTEQIISAHRTLDQVLKRARHMPEADAFRAFLRTVIETRQLTPIPGGARSPLGQNLAAVFDQSHRAHSRETSPVPSGNPPGRRGSLKKRALPSPSVKEFILRTVASRPYNSSRASVHRMYAAFRPGDVRIAGAFTEDLLYG